MPKVENPHLIQIEFDGGRAQISQPEYELSADEWYRRRTDAFAQLRKAGGIPDEILDLVEHFKEQTLVEPYVVRPGEKVELRFGVKVLGPKDGEKGMSLEEMIAIGKRLHDDKLTEGMTASDALAFFLRMSLRELKHAEKNRKAAPVRSLGLTPRSLIAEIAMDLLGSCETWGYPPGGFLNSLMRELLDLDHDRQGMSRDVERQEQAASIVAQFPSVPTRKLARAVGVNASTISRWRRSPEFERLVKRKAELPRDTSRTSEKLAAFAEEGPAQKEALALLLATAARLSKTERND